MLHVPGRIVEKRRSERRGEYRIFVPAIARRVTSIRSDRVSLSSTNVRSDRIFVPAIARAEHDQTFYFLPEQSRVVENHRESSTTTVQKREAIPRRARMEGS